MTNYLFLLYYNHCINSKNNFWNIIYIHENGERQKNMRKSYIFREIIAKNVAYNLAGLNEKDAGGLYLPNLSSCSFFQAICEIQIEKINGAFLPDFRIEIK